METSAVGQRALLEEPLAGRWMSNGDFRLLLSLSVTMLLTEHETRNILSSSNASDSRYGHGSVVGEKVSLEWRYTRPFLERLSRLRVHG